MSVRQVTHFQSGYTPPSPLFNWTTYPDDALILIFNKADLKTVCALDQVDLKGREIAHHLILKNGKMAGYQGDHYQEALPFAYIYERARTIGYEGKVSTVFQRISELLNDERTFSTISQKDAFINEMKKGKAFDDVAFYFHINPNLCELIYWVYPDSENLLERAKGSLFAYVRLAPILLREGKLSPDEMGIWFQQQEKEMLRFFEECYESDDLIPYLIDKKLSPTEYFVKTKFLSGTPKDCIEFLKSFEYEKYSKVVGFHQFLIDLAAKGKIWGLKEIDILFLERILKQGARLQIRDRNRSRLDPLSSSIMSYNLPFFDWAAGKLKDQMDVSLHAQLVPQFHAQLLNNLKTLINEIYPTPTSIKNEILNIFSDNYKNMISKLSSVIARQ